ncbi:MAG: hypothetical protein IT410_01440 [Candidatus Doudnabacteria bacterium]|nr:hypothetical protein [Candidatus Doudnabacteria bacterium]
MKRIIVVLFALIVSAGATFGQQPATFDRPVLVDRSAGQVVSQRRQIEIEELIASYPEGFDARVLEYRLSSVDMARLRVIVGEFASRRKLTGSVKVQVQMMFEGAMSDTPYRDNAREELKGLMGRSIANGADAAGRSARYKLPYSVGYEVENVIRDGGRTTERIVVNPRQRQTLSVYINIEAPGFSRANVVTFDYDVTSYDNGTHEVRVHHGDRLRVVSLDERKSLHLAGPGRPGLSHNVNLDGLADVVTVAVAIVEVGR